MQDKVFTAINVGIEKLVLEKYQLEYSGKPGLCMKAMVPFTVSKNQDKPASW